MKNVIGLVFFSMFLTSVIAQVEGGINEKLAKSYQKGDYEGCMLKAVDLTYNDKYKKDPEPYLYAAFCYYQISLSEDPSILEDYPNALKDAIKYLIKFKKKDKEGELAGQNDGEINTILAAYFEEAVDFFKKENYKSAAYNFKQLTDWYDENTDLIFLQAMCDALEGKSTASQYFDQSIPVFLEQKKSGNIKVRREVKEIFSDSFIKYADYLNTTEKADSAKATLNLGLTLLPGNINIQSKIDSLEN